MKLPKNIFTLFIFCSLLATSCSKDYITPIPVEPIAPNTPIDSVFFTLDIQPILANCIGCHPGTNALDLTTNNAYNQLLTYGPNAPYIIAGDPATSLLYIKINIGGSMNSYVGSQSDITKIFDWINQGALNN